MQKPGLIRALLTTAVVFSATTLLGGNSFAALRRPQAIRPAAVDAGALKARSERPWLPKDGVKATTTGGNTIGAAVREENPRADGYRHIDTKRLIQQLRKLNVNTYIFGIWDSPTDWDDLRNEFLPAADRAGIDVWVYLVPPSECSTSDDPSKAGRCSRPYQLDFKTWAREIATLSMKYPNLTAWAIDDFSIPENAALFTPAYVSEFRGIAEQINPKLGFYLTAYYSAARDDAFLDKYAPYLDGIIYPYLDDPNWNNTETGSAPARIEELLSKTQPRGLGLVFLAYANRYLAATLPPNASYVDKLLSIGLDYTHKGLLDGVISYGTPLDGDNQQHDLRIGGQWGAGRLSLNLPAWAPTSAGQYAEASQVVTVDPNAPRYELSFWQTDSQDGGPGSYHIKQVLLDGEVVWQSDVTDQFPRVWINGNPAQGAIDVTRQLRGKTQATLSVRLYERYGVSYFPVDVGFDNFQSIGFTIQNPGFESDGGWALKGFGNLQAVIHVYHENEPQRIFDAVSARFGKEEES